MSNHVLDSDASGLEILTGVKVIGMSIEILTDAASHSKTKVGVDIDLADSHPLRTSVR